MPRKSIAHHFKAAHRIEAKPGAWKKHIDKNDESLLIGGHVTKTMGVLCFGTTLALGTPLTIAVAAAFWGVTHITGSLVNGEVQTNASNTANQQTAIKRGLQANQAKKTNFLKNFGKQLLRPL